MANKPKNWDALSPVEQEAWRVKARERSRKSYKANREKRLESNRKYREANLEKVRERKCKWRKANPEKARETARKWQKSNPKKQREHERKARHKTKNQTAADQFFIMAGAAEQLTKLKPKQ